MGDLDEQLLTRLGWHQLNERSWTELVGRGLPGQLAALSHDLGDRNERPIRVFTLPTMEAGVASLAVPFAEDDGILFDPVLLEDRCGLTTEIARGLGYMLYPSWEEAGLDEYDEMIAFASVLTRVLVNWLPRRVCEIDLTAQLVLHRLRRS